MELFRKRCHNSYMEKYMIVEIMKKAVIAMLILTLLLSCNALFIAKSNAYVTSQSTNYINGTFQAITGNLKGYTGTYGSAGNFQAPHFLYFPDVVEYNSPNFVKIFGVDLSLFTTTTGSYDNIILKESATSKIIGHGKLSFSKNEQYLQFLFYDFNASGLTGAHCFFMYDSDNTTKVYLKSTYATNGFNYLSGAKAIVVSSQNYGIEFGADIAGNCLLAKTSAGGPGYTYQIQYQSVKRVDYVAHKVSYSGATFYDIFILKSFNGTYYNSKFFVKSISDNNYVYLSELTYNSVNNFVEIPMGLTPSKSINLTAIFYTVGSPIQYTDTIMLSNNITTQFAIVGNVVDSITKNLIPNSYVVLQDYNNVNLTVQSLSYSNYEIIASNYALKNGYTYHLIASANGYQSQNYYFAYPSTFNNNSTIYYNFELSPIAGGGEGLYTAYFIQGDVRDLISSNYIGSFNFTLKDSSSTIIKTYSSANGISNNVWSYFISLPLNLNIGMQYSLICSSPNYNDNQYDFIFPPQYQISNVNFDMITNQIPANTGVIKVLVLDANTQAPILGADAVLYNSSPTWNYYQLTDRFGNATFVNLPYDVYRVEVGANGYFGTNRIIQVTGTNLYFWTCYLHKITASYTPIFGNVTVLPSNTVLPPYYPSITIYPNGTYPNGTISGGNMFGSMFLLWGITDSFTQGLILGVIVVLLCTGFFVAIGAIATKNSQDSKAPMVLGVIGAVFGFVVSGYTQLFPIWFVVVVVLIALAILLYLGKMGGDS